MLEPSVAHGDTFADVRWWELVSRDAPEAMWRQDRNSDPHHNDPIGLSVLFPARCVRDSHSVDWVGY
jgi:hypothetical protein